MTNWIQTVNLKHFYHNDDYSIKEKANMVANELKRILKLSRFKDDTELEQIIEDFKYVSGDGEPEETSDFTITDDFNARMSELYDWADYNKVWIATIL